MTVLPLKIVVETDHTPENLPALKTEIVSIVDARSATLAKIEDATAALEHAYGLSGEVNQLAQQPIWPPILRM